MGSALTQAIAVILSMPLCRFTLPSIITNGRLRHFHLSRVNLQTWEVGLLQLFEHFTTEEEEVMGYRTFRISNDGTAPRAMNQSCALRSFDQDCCWDLQFYRLWASSERRETLDPCQVSAVPFLPTVRFWNSQKDIRGRLGRGARDRGAVTPAGSSTCTTEPKEIEPSEPIEVLQDPEVEGAKPEEGPLEEDGAGEPASHLQTFRHWTPWLEMNWTLLTLCVTLLPCNPDSLSPADCLDAERGRGRPGPVGALALLD